MNYKKEIQDTYKASKIEPVMDMVGLEVDYSVEKPFFKTEERQHIREQTELFLASGGSIYKAALGESKWDNNVKEKTKRQTNWHVNRIHYAKKDKPSAADCGFVQNVLP